MLWPRYMAYFMSSSRLALKLLDSSPCLLFCQFRLHSSTTATLGTEDSGRNKEVFRCRMVYQESRGSLSNNDRDGYENKIVNSRCLKLHRAYFISFHLSNVGKFFLVLNSKGLYQSSGKEKESCCLVFPSSKKKNVKLGTFIVQRRLRNRDRRAKLLCC